jgi:FKBP-type peptidyl-prolyl cis-trans isomerase FkpA
MQATQIDTDSLKNKMLKNSLLIITSVAIFSSCNQFKVKTEDGIKFQMHEEGKDTKTAKDGDLVTFHLLIKTSGDSTLRNTYKEGTPMTYPLQKGQFKGSFENALYKFSVGDSATVFVSADSLFGMMQQPLPPFVTKGSDLKFTCKVVKIQTREDFAHAMNERKAGEAKTLEEYAKKNMPTATKTANGIYYLVNKAGTGASPTAGKSVSMLYTGKLLSGKVFDASSLHGGAPFSFPLGQQAVIPGWDQVVAMMKKGEKCTVLIPSSLAYGEQGAGGMIEPHTPLIFEMELVDFK